MDSLCLSTVLDCAVATMLLLLKAENLRLMNNELCPIHIEFVFGYILFYAKRIAHNFFLFAMSTRDGIYTKKKKRSLINCLQSQWPS